MLKHRLLMSALLIPATIGLFVWDQHLGESAPVLLVLVLLISARCVWELTTLARHAGFCPSPWVLVAANSLLIFVSWLPRLDNSGQLRFWFLAQENFVSWLTLFAGISLCLLLNAFLRYPLDNTRSTEIRSDSDLLAPGARVPVVAVNEVAALRGREIGTLGFELFVIVYIGVLLTMTSQLRWLEHRGRPFGWVEAEVGYFVLGALMVATKMGDVGAYTFGRLIGGPKMVPRLSPGKTWAGGVGHLITAGLCSVAWLCWLGPSISYRWDRWPITSAFVFGVVVGFAGLIGDLFESLIKRDVGVKDAPALLPGFGGLLDLMDSILLAGPVAYGMWHLLR